jgi:hypothetical protein
VEHGDLIREIRVRNLLPSRFVLAFGDSYGIYLHLDIPGEVDCRNTDAAPRIKDSLARQEANTADLVVQQIGNVFGSESLYDFSVHLQKLRVMRIIETTDLPRMGVFVSFHGSRGGAFVVAVARRPEAQLDLIPDIRERIGLPEASGMRDRVEADGTPL